MFTTGLHHDSGSIAQGAGVGLFTTGLAPTEAQVLRFDACNWFKRAAPSPAVSHLEAL